MGNIGEDADTSPMKMEKKKMKKSKNKTNNLPDVVDGGGNNGRTHVEEIDDDHSKEKEHKHMKKKKKKSESKEDEDASIIKMEKKKKKKSKNKTNNLSDDNNDDGNGNNHVEEIDDDGFSKEKEHKPMKKKHNKSESSKDEDKVNLEDNGDLQKKNKKKRKRDSSEDSPKPKKHKKKNLENDSEKPKSKSIKKPKKVTFSSDVEIFPSPTTKKPQKTKSDNNNNNNLVRGKRFTQEEDEIVKQAVNDYITSNNLGDDGLQMILNCRSHKGLKNCWQEIGTCIPYRPYTAIYYRAHILFEQSEHRLWTPDEINFLKESHKIHGNKWKMIAKELGKHQVHVKDTWRRIKLDNLKAGKWSQDEYQDLYDLVNLDLQVKVNEQEKKSKHGMLRDNIPWTAISEKLSTRSDANCCLKWYEQLTSSLVAEKKWSDADDYWLVGRLYEIDAACVEDVDWDGVLEHRSGEVCRKRWDQMVVCIGNHKSKTFGEQVEILAKRYRPELAEVRQTWDDKPRVP